MSYDAQGQKMAASQRTNEIHTETASCSNSQTCQSTLHMQLTISKDRCTSVGWWQHLPHTAHSKPCSCWNKHPALPVPSSAAKQYTGLAFLPDSPSPLGEMKQEGTTSPSKPPEATTHFTNLNWYISYRLGLIPHKTNRPPQCTK